MNWYLIGIIAYVVILILVCLRIIFETHSSTKTLAYLLLCIFAPIFGIVFYITFGINYWKIKLYSKKTELNEKLLKQIIKTIPHYESSIITHVDNSSMQNAELISMVLKNIKSPLTRHNRVKLDQW